MPHPALQLFDPRNGGMALKIEPFAGQAGLSESQRTNYFTVFWIRQGNGTFWADAGEFSFGPNSLLFLVPYQSYRFQHDGPTQGQALQFHANFFCIETHHEEVGCNGVLFNDLYGIPVVTLDAAAAEDLSRVIDDMSIELAAAGLAHSEVLLSYLKILLVRMTRLKMQQQDVPQDSPARLPPVLGELKTLIEKHFRTHHAPADYADLLHLSPKSLAKLVKTHLHKTLTELIRERLLKQAKWELLHTLKPVKNIAAELGFSDVFYFSRLFKRTTGFSPTDFRDYETAIRGGRNLSMR